MMLRPRDRAGESSRFRSHRAKAPRYHGPSHGHRERWYRVRARKHSRQPGVSFQSEKGLPVTTPAAEKIVFSSFEEFLDRYGPRAGAEGPVRFVREVLGGVPDPWQEEVLRAYGAGVRLISIRSPHGPGKTTAAAWCATHSIVCRFPQRTVCTAPTSGQLYDALFAEIKIWIRRLPADIARTVEMKADKIVLVAAPEASYITARTAKAENPEALQGIHSAHVLLLCDEASAIPEAIFEAGAGSMSGENATTMLFSNPTRLSGTFYESQTRLRDVWWTRHVKPEDSPPPEPAKGRLWGMSPKFEQDLIHRYGRDSNQYRVRWLGEFPTAEANTIIPYDLADAALSREIEANPKGIETWGLDCARFGDDRSTLCKRRGDVMPEPIRVWRHLDTMALADAVHAEWQATRESERPVEILVDVIGIGAGVVDRLRQLGLPAIGVNVSELPAVSIEGVDSPERFLNLRAQLWWAAKEWFTRRQGRIRDDQERTLIGELTTVRYSFTPQTNKIKVESKAEIKKAGRESPDCADAFVLTFASTAASLLGSFGPPSDWSTPMKRNYKGVV
jgi:phage terminase large subunit